MHKTQLELIPLRPGLVAGQDNELHVLARVRAAAKQDGEDLRQPLNLALVIDRSGSMDGEPLREALRCARFIVDSMRPSDIAALVVYDEKVDTLIPASGIKDRKRFHRALAHVHSGGCTALFDGWFEGAGQAAGFANADVISRVLLLSDGCANRGLTAIDDIVPRCAEMAAAGVSTSTYGLGHHFNEMLMGEMAKAGNGNGYYGESAEDLIDPFRQEFDLLSALCGRELQMGIEATPDTGIEVLNGYKKGAQGRTILPDLAAGADVWALVKLQVPGAALLAGDIRHVVAVSVGYRDLASGQPAFLSKGLDLRVMTKREFATLIPDPTVQARVQELRLAAFQERIRHAALDQDWDRVDRLLGEAESEAHDNPWLAEGLVQLRHYASLRDVMRTSKESYYSSSRLRSRYTSVDEPLGRFSAKEELSARSFLRRKATQGKKSGAD